jgi:hypothetical protein
MELTKTGRLLLSNQLLILEAGYPDDADSDFTQRIDDAMPPRRR